MWRSWNGVYFSTQQEAQRHDQKHGDHGKAAEYHEEGLGGMICVLVDDILGGGRGKRFEESLQQLKQAVKFGKWETFEDEREYSGKTIKQNSDASIVLSME
eukprot:3289725-Amphidinium_carterae.1